MNLFDKLVTEEYFLGLFSNRKNSLIENKDIQSEFKKEMRRFLPAAQVNEVVEKNNLWPFLIYLVGDFGSQMHACCRGSWSLRFRN
jgi:hypothetical protein